MIRVRKSSDRGQFDFGWLKTAHTFSFAEYRDDKHVHFRNLRVMNEDRIAGGAGFPPHPHRDMEIITYVLEGALEHRDSMGNHGVIKPGIVQRMSAGTGVTHSEYNALPDQTTHLYQIWIFPRAKGVDPGYEEKALPGFDESGRLVLVASPDGANGSVTINADTRLYAARLKAGQAIDHTLAHGNAAWVQVIRGGISVNGETLGTSDGAAIEELGELHIEAATDSEILLFDLD
jgi:redox-sensitive bicupin YhaK (pirin superfamily)